MFVSVLVDIQTMRFKAPRLLHLCTVLYVYSVSADHSVFAVSGYEDYVVMYRKSITIFSEFSTSSTASWVRRHPRVREPRVRFPLVIGCADDLRFGTLVAALSHPWRDEV